MTLVSLLRRLFNSTHIHTIENVLNIVADTRIDDDD